MRLTIVGAITKVLGESEGSMSAKAIYNSIVDKAYYQFNAQNPYSVVRVELRRHCNGVDFPTSSPQKYFQILNDGTYTLIEPYHIDKKESLKLTTTTVRNTTEVSSSMSVSNLKVKHSEFTIYFKESILDQLKAIEPDTFEIFCKKLLSVYGFKDLKVTRKSKDGGIDGEGKLKVGISHLNVAVQCKRWNKTSVGRTEIDKFRGAIQGDFEQGIFFTTSKFSKEAMQATTKKGAVPIILIDGSTIVDIMIEKKFGIDIENLPVYINALDEVLNED